MLFWMCNDSRLFQKVPFIYILNNVTDIKQKVLIWVCENSARFRADISNLATLQYILTTWTPELIFEKYSKIMTLEEKIWTGHITTLVHYCSRNLGKIYPSIKITGMTSLPFLNWTPNGYQLYFLKSQNLLYQKLQKNFGTCAYTLWLVT